MDVKEFEALKKELDSKKTKKIQLETQKSEIEKNWKAEHGTSDSVKVAEILTEKKEENKIAESKRAKLITSLQEILA